LHTNPNRNLVSKLRQALSSHARTSLQHRRRLLVRQTHENAAGAQQEPFLAPPESASRGAVLGISLLAAQRGQCFPVLISSQVTLRHL